MKHTLIALLLMTSPAAALDIHSSRGGSMVEHFIKYSRAGHIRILGRCDSACTLALGFGACVGPRAVLGFHSPDRGKRAARAFMLRNYPPKVRAWVRARGALNKSSLTYLRGAELRRLVRSC